MAANTSRPTLRPLLDVIERHWGFRTLRPLQEEAMRAVLDGRDSLVVLPTGGGKSLCYQAPAVLHGGTTVVVSPLIALMKDQVDSLRACGVSAASLDSSLTSLERSVHFMDLRQGEVRVLFVSPERLVQTDLYPVFQQIGVRTFAIDEAHCISHWGHDFRPEYRQLRQLRDHFPGASVHAYTATATERVRGDIVEQLGLRDPVTLVGNFDRPNLTYRVLPRRDLLKQVGEVLDRHEGEAGIIYCLRRRDVDDLALALRTQGVNVMAYHAGMNSDQRQIAQDAFRSERCDVMVATVAFGMGIDRSNVRFVLHAALPKSLEHYQQETGRAGRDGLEAECVLLFSGADAVTLKSIVEKSAEEADPPVDREFVESSKRHIEDMDRFARGAVCRHRALVEYFGQPLEGDGCGACDICLGDTEAVPDAVVVAQKILSCVARVKESFGINHVIAVLRGKDTEGVRKRGHEKLTTYGLLSGASDADLRDWIYQLIGQGVLMQSAGEYPLLKLNDGSWEVMKGKRSVRLVQLVRRKKGEKPERSRAAAVSWEGVDQGLFNVLKGLRREVAAERGVPPYVVFEDSTLREMARIRPSTPERMRQLYGIGDKRLKDYGERFLAAINGHCTAAGLSMDVTPPPSPTPPAPREEKSGLSKLTARRTAFVELFREGAAIEDVMHRLNYKRSTVYDYLAEFVREERPASIRAWVADEVYHKVRTAALEVGTDRLKPIYLALGEQVSYDEIRLVLAHLQP